MKTYKLTTPSQVREALRDGAKVYFITSIRGYKRQILEVKTQQVYQYMCVHPRYEAVEHFVIEMSERANKESYEAPANLILSNREVFAEI